MNDELLHVHRLTAPVSNLGYGRRVVLWISGCSIGCPGCCSKDTWSRAGAGMVPGAALQVIGALAERHRDLDGITVSGGEPTEAGPALERLLASIRTRWPEWDVLLYSGLPWARLRGRFGALLAHCDAVVPEPFVHDRPATHPLLGSANQSLRLLTAKGHQRYGTASLPQGRLEAAIDRDGIALTGVPGPGDLERLEAALARRGIALVRESWR